MAYASVDDLQSRWRKLTDDESSRAAILLEDAATLLDALLGERAGEESLAGALRMVSCNMVRRYMATTVEGDYSSVSRTAGSFNEQYAPRESSGSLYVKAAEKELLGLTGSGQVAVISSC